MLGYNLLNIICDDYGRHEVTLYTATSESLNSSDEFLSEGISLLKTQLNRRFNYSVSDEFALSGDLIDYGKEDTIKVFESLNKFKMAHDITLSHDLLMIDMRLTGKTISPTYIGFTTKKGDIVTIEIISSKQNFIVINLKTGEYKSTYPIKLDWYKREN